MLSYRLIGHELISACHSKACLKLFFIEISLSRHYLSSADCVINEDKQTCLGGMVVAFPGPVFFYPSSA